MKSEETKNAVKKPKQTENVEILQQQIEEFEREKVILLALSKDLTTVREKSDLVKVFSSRLKSFFYFTHVIITLIDHQKKIFYPFLWDPVTHPIRDAAILNDIMSRQFPLENSPFIDIMDPEIPKSFLLEELMKKSGMPSFVKLNYDHGIRETLITPLRNKGETFGFILIYSDKPGSFSEDFKNIIGKIIPHLSNAVSNIIINDEIRHKEYITATLLSLSNDMVTVRERTDLLKVINFGLKKLIYFTHSVMTELSEGGETYHAFLTDPDSRAKQFPEYAQMIGQAVTVKDGIYDVATASYKPVVFDMKSVDQDKAPLWLRLNYEAGAKEMMVKVLPGVDSAKHSIILFSDKEKSFDKESVEVVERISSQLATAASNIAANEQIINKEKDKSFLLEFGHNLAAARTRGELSQAIHSSLKKLSTIRAYFIRTLNDDGKTMSPFMHDDEVFYKDDPEFVKLLKTRIPVASGITARVMNSSSPIMIDFVEEIKNGNSDPYIEFWKKLGPQKSAFRKMIGTALSVGELKLGILWVITEQINTTILEGICAQISIAVSNIISNEETIRKDQEKSYLLEFSKDIATVRSKEELGVAVQRAVKKLSSVKGYVIRLINDDQTTVSPYIWDSTIPFKDDPEFKQLVVRKLIIKDGFHDKVLNSGEPVLFNIEKEAEKQTAPQYIRFWKRVNFLRMTGTALRTGNANIGILWMETDVVNISLLKGICAQLSIAISNIRANEEILVREEEKSFLLSLSDEIAALRNRNDLLHVVNSKIKTLFHIEEFGIAKINEDGLTYSAFIMDLGDDIKGRSDYDKITSSVYKVTDRVFSHLMASEDPVLFNVKELQQEKDLPAYVGFWKEAGLKEVLGIALRAGGKNIGCAFLHTHIRTGEPIKLNLLQSVCAQLAVAISNILANEKVLLLKQLLEVENDHLKEQIKTIYNFSDIIGSGPAMQKVYQMMSLVAESASTVLLLGETGTGKELIARAIHNASPRKNKLMVKVNCAALPANLIESELFGHEKGSFTGAIDRRIGKFELANNSTLFLDEIGEMPLETQVKLLRVIQERELERVGGITTIKVDVRIIAATNRNLQTEVNAGRFRSDLYYRLNVFPIVLPPLRERLEDIAPLANFFLERYSKATGKKVTSIAASVTKELKGYSWPGNVRELEHLIERSILLTRENVLKHIQLPNNNDIINDQAEPTNKSLQDIERSYIIDVLKKYNGKIAGSDGAAHFLEIPSTTLHSKMKKLGISKSDYLPQ